MRWWWQKADREEDVVPDVDAIERLADEARKAKAASNDSLRAAKRREPDVASVHQFAKEVVTRNHLAELITDSMQRRMQQ